VTEATVVIEEIAAETEEIEASDLLEPRKQLPQLKQHPLPRHLQQPQSNGPVTNLRKGTDDSVPFLLFDLIVVKPLK